MALQAITIPPASGQPPRGTVVILHGWGASAKDVWSLASLVHLPDFQLVFPDAPFSHPYSSGGKMWYDFPGSFNFQGTPEFRDRKDLSTSRQLLTDFLKALPTTTGVPLSRTVLGGFSQGGAMTLDVGLGLPLAGLMVLSGYLHAPIVLSQTALPPVLMIHGKQDSVVPLAAAQRALASLRSLGADVRYQEFDMGHEIQPLVLKLIQSFVEELLPNNK
ncbi:MAG TPA: alpha/beta hydrolase [Thermosynechococcaceae cyanobacterium]